MWVFSKIKLIMPFLYLIVGLYVMFLKPYTFEINEYILGLIIIFYGIIRFYKVYYPR